VIVIVRVDVCTAIEVGVEVMLGIGGARMREAVEDIETADIILLLTEIAVQMRHGKAIAWNTCQDCGKNAQKKDPNG